MKKLMVIALCALVGGAVCGSQDPTKQHCVAVCLGSRPLLAIQKLCLDLAKSQRDLQGVNLEDWIEKTAGAEYVLKVARNKNSGCGNGMEMNTSGSCYPVRLNEQQTEAILSLMFPPNLLLSWKIANDNRSNPWAALKRLKLIKSVVR